MNGINGLNGHAAPPSLWQEARNSDGRVYYYNTITKATQWTKPEDLMTPAEVTSTYYFECIRLLTYLLACPCITALEGVHCRGRQEILVQY
jgi:hypothetical protein